MRFAKRMQRLGTESAFEYLARARALEAQGREVIHLEIGEPDFPTPQHIVDAASQAMEEGYTHYTQAAGLPQVREAVARHVTATRGFEVGADHVVLVPGSKNVLHFLLLSCVDEGEEVIVPDPGYPIYRSLVEFTGAVAVSLPLREGNGFRADVEELRRLVTPRTRLIVINSPQNPTGSVLTREDVRAVAELCRERGILVLSDEIYSEIRYEGAHRSVCAEPGMGELAVLLDGLSKAYAMTGWRLGYAVCNLELAQRMSRLMINTSSCAAAFTQMATIAALEGPQEPVHAMVAEFRARRDLMVDGLNALPGFRCALPGGAFYAFPNIQGTGMGEHELCELLLQRGGVSCLPGTAFGAMGKGFLRFSYANSQENIRKGLQLMGEVLAEVRATEVPASR
jgi:aspartate/methionine/tyrosine aminotransferase